MLDLRPEQLVEQQVDRTVGQSHAPFIILLADAQGLGFAEADPSFDVDGVDAAHKLSILASLAFGTRIAFDAVAMQGIREVLAGDIAEARTLGYRIRLVGHAEAGGGGIYQRVAPCLVPASHPLAAVGGAMNAVVAEGNFVGRLFFSGSGAGAGPTASAVVADLMLFSRIEAACLPENLASRGVLERSGFKYEGVAQSYLQINGRWRNHVLYSNLRHDRRGRTDAG